MTPRQLRDGGVEGTRPSRREIQALVDHSYNGVIRAAWQWGWTKPVGNPVAVLHRHGGLQMADQDVFVNVVGGA
ncbi:hypothetical protein ACNKHN_24995 [Shigella flexneri]